MTSEKQYPTPRLINVANLLSEKLGLTIDIGYDDYADRWFYSFLINETGEHREEETDYYTTYDEALDAAIARAEELIADETTEK